MVRAAAPSSGAETQGVKLMVRSLGLGASIALAAALGAVSAHAGEADVVEVAVQQTGAGVYRFDVTVAHADEGWDHYADLWEVVGPDGAVLGARTLHHPHVNEQPFTRSLSGVEIPEVVTEVVVRSRDSQHGFGGVEKTVAVPR